MQQLMKGLLVGVVTTLSMDILTVLASRLGLIAPLPPHLIGRWFASVIQGQPFHADIAQSPQLSYEMALALPGHYLIGITLACLYLWSTSQLALPAQHIAVALGYGLCTNVLPWLIMFPAMGYGFFGVRGPSGTRLFVSSLCSHAFYGLGLWLTVSFLVPLLWKHNSVSG